MKKKGGAFSVTPPDFCRSETKESDLIQLIRQLGERGTMNILKIIAELREERACLDEVLIGLEKLSLKRTPRRGRPPAWSRVTSLTGSKSGNGLHNSMNGAPHLAAAGKAAH